MISSRPLLSRLLFWVPLLMLWAGGLYAYLSFIIWPRVDLLAFEALDRTFEIIAPRFFGLLLLLPLLPIGTRVTLSDFPAYQKGINLLLRALLITAIVASLVQVVMTSFDSRVATIYLVDTSASMTDEALAQALIPINAAAENLAENNTLLVLGFAARPYPILPDAEGQFTDIPRPERDDDLLSTDISAALRMAYGLFPDDHLKRIVLLTDGNENTGDFLAEVDRASDFGIRLFTHQLDYKIPPEVMIQGVDVPENIEMGAPFFLTARIFSTHDDEVRLTLWQNEFREDQQTLEIPRGVTEVRFETLVSESGFREFRLAMTVAGRDTHEANNHFLHTAYISGEPRILYVEGEFRSRHYLERALQNENFEVETRSPNGIPRTEEEFDAFDLILLSDVHAEHFSAQQMDALSRYVRDSGGGLIMTGGQDSFGPGGWENTPIEALMPVRFEMEERRDIPDLALLLVIDRSGSMDEQNRMTLAKEAAQAAVNALNRNAEVGIIAFDHEPTTISRIQSTSNRSRILSQINRIQTRGNTDIARALAQAYYEIAFHPARTRHIILLTDGISPEDNLFTETMPAMRLENITVSTVAVGDSSETSLMRRIASAGNGRFYFTNNPFAIPQIFTQETQTVSSQSLQEAPFRPQVHSPAQILQGIPWNQAPMLLGYVSTKARPQAEVLLLADRNEPLLARWRLGLGKTAVFTSDIKNRWGSQWVRWTGYSQLWAQLIRDTMRTDDRDLLPMQAFVDQNQGRATVDAIGLDDLFINGLESTLQVTTPDGEELILDFHQRAPGRYEATFPLDSYGSYHLSAQHFLDGDTLAVSQSSLSYPYPRELSFVEPNTPLVIQAVELSGGTINPTVFEIFDPRNEEVRYRRLLWPYFVVIALLLLLLDLAIRRIRLSGKTRLSWTDFSNS